MKTIFLAVLALLLVACSQGVSHDEMKAALAERDAALDVLATAMLKCCDRELPDPE